MPLRSIPCVIHQTWKSHELLSPQNRYAETWTRMNPDCEYRLWNDTEIALLAQRESPNVIWPVWDGFSPVEKADVFRYLVLWCFGGYYADADVECARPISTWDVPKDTDLIVGPFGGFDVCIISEATSLGIASQSGSGQRSSLGGRSSFSSGSSCRRRGTPSCCKSCT